MCFVLASLCHGRTNCFNQFQKSCMALEPSGKIEIFKGKCPEHWEGKRIREERSDILPSAHTLTGGIWSVQEAKIREGSSKALNMNKWFPCRYWLWMTPDHWTAKMEPNPLRSRLGWGSWGCSKSGWLIQFHPSSLPCERAWQPGGSCAPFKPHHQFGCLRSTAGHKCLCTGWRSLQREQHQTSARRDGACLAVDNWSQWKTLLHDVSAGLTEKKQQSPALYKVLCGRSSKTTLHSLEFSFERSCIKENNSATIFFRRKWKKKFFLKLTLGSLFKRAWNYLNYTREKKKRKTCPQGLKNHFSNRWLLTLHQKMFGRHNFKVLGKCVWWLLGWKSKCSPQWDLSNVHISNQNLAGPAARGEGQRGSQL